MREEDCIFCKIANGEISSLTIYEDELFRAILDVSPATKGHTLIVPKDHCNDLFELSKIQATKIMSVAQVVGKQLQEKLNCQGMNIIQNNGSVAGQTVFHYHLHLIPRYESDGQQINWNPIEKTKDQLEHLHHMIMS